MFSAGFLNRCFVGALAVGMSLGFGSISEAQDKDQDKDKKDAQKSDSKATGAQGGQTDPLKRPVP